MDARLVTVIVVAAIAVMVWVAGKLLASKLPEQLGALISQLVPVLILAVVVVGILIVIDPDQAEDLQSSVQSSVPKVLIAIIMLIVARALGRIVGLFLETALRSISAVIAARARLAVSSVILGVGIIIAMGTLGIPTAIIQILVAALAFGVALALALTFGLGTVPVARQIAAGRHVQNRYSAGDMIRVGDVEGRVMEVGLATTRIELGGGKQIDVPNHEFLQGVTAITT
jgi:small-conductance mechanosensitive channel